MLKDSKKWCIGCIGLSVLNSVIDNNVGNDSYDDAYENDIGPVDIPLLPVEMVFIGLM